MIVTLGCETMSKESRAKVLEFSNHLLQLKSASDVYKALEGTVKQNGGKLDFKVSNLVDGLGSLSLPTATSCAAILTSALEKGWLDLSSFLSVLVSQASSVHHYSIVVSCIAKALLWEMEVVQQHQAYVCPYSLRLNVHPFISVLNSRPECGWSIISVLKRMYLTNTTSVILKVVEPFLKYVLLHPNPTPELSHIGCHLQSELISLASSSLSHLCHSKTLVELPPEALSDLQRSQSMVKFLVKMLPLQPTRTDQQLVFVSTVLERIIMVIMEIQDLIDDRWQDIDALELIDMNFSYLCELTQRGLPCYALLEHLSLLFKITKVHCAPHHWLVLGWLLLRNLLSPPSITCLLELCTFLLSVPSSAESAATLLTYPLVQLLAQPSTALAPFTSRDNVLSNQKTASILLRQLEGLHSIQLFTTTRGALLSCSLIYTKLLSTARKFVGFDSQQLEEMAKRLTQDKSRPSGSNSGVVIVLAGLALAVVGGDDVTMMRSVLNTITAVARSDPTESPSILSFFLYLQSLAQKPEFKVSILYSLPSLSTHKLATIGVVSTVQALGGTPSLLPLAIRLMERVWQQQDHIFPFLNEMLSRQLPPLLTQQLVDDVTLTRAIVIRDVCQQKAEVHGEEMLKHISQFLLSSTSHPVPIAMAIEGLVALCRSEVTDVATLWGVLSSSQWKVVDDGSTHAKGKEGKSLGGFVHRQTVMIDALGVHLCDHIRPVVVSALCQLFELASEVDSESRHANKVFKITALKYLWSCALSNDATICSAAFKSLSKFQLEDYLVEHMPHKMRAKFEADTPSDPATSTPLTGRDCVELVNHIPVECAQAYGTYFLTSLVRTELKDVQRGAVYSALREAQLPSQMERVLVTVREMLPSLCSENLKRDVASTGLIRGTLMRECEAEGGRATGRVGKQALNKRLQEMLLMLEEFLRAGVASTDLGGREGNSWVGLSCLSVSEQWRRFIGKLLVTYRQLRLLDTHSVSMEEELVDPIYLRKKKEAADWSMSQVVDKLRSFSRSNADSAPNVLLALVGVVSNVAPQCGDGEDVPHLIDLLDGFTHLLSGKVESVTRSTLTFVQSLFESGHTDLPLAVVLSVPALVGGVQSLYWAGLTDTITHKIVDLVGSLFEHFSSTPQWYYAAALNQVLMNALPVVNRLDGVMLKIIPFLEASTKSDNLELLSLTAGLLPSLILYGGHTHLAKSVLSALQHKLSSLPQPALAMASVQLCSLHLANGAVQLYTVGGLTDKETTTVVTALAELASKSPQTILPHLSLSTALVGLACHGNQNALSLADTIAAKWLQEAKELLTKEGRDQVLPILFGLSGFVGLNPLLGAGSAVMTNSSSFVKTLAPPLFSLLQEFVAHQDSAICSSSLWMLSQVHSAVSDITEQEEKVPVNYSYLPDDSALNSLYLTMESLSSPPHNPHKLDVLRHLLISLVACREAQFPPAKFSGFLTPLLRCGDELELTIVSCLVNLKETQGLRQLATYCCQPLVFSSLQADSKCLILENIAILLETLLLKSFAKFVHAAAVISVSYLQRDCQDLLIKSLLTGLSSACSSGGLADQAKKCLCNIIVKLYVDVSSISDVAKTVSAPVCLKGPLLEIMSTCLSHCDPEEVSQRCKISSSSPVTLSSRVSSVMHCCWVRSGVRNCKTLASVIEWILTNADNSNVVCPLRWLLLTVRECCSETESSNTLEMNQSSIIHIVSSWTRATQLVSSGQMDILLLVVSAVCGAPNAATRRYLDLPVGEDIRRCDALLEVVESQGQLYELPASHSIRDKLCLFLLELMNALPMSKDKFIGTTLTLKSVEEFNAPVIWTSVAQWWQYSSDNI